MKRITAVLLTLAMCFALFTVSAGAADYVPYTFEFSNGDVVEFSGARVAEETFTIREWNPDYDGGYAPAEQVTANVIHVEPGAAVTLSEGCGFNTLGFNLRDGVYYRVSALGFEWFTTEIENIFHGNADMLEFAQDDSGKIIYYVVIGGDVPEADASVAGFTDVSPSDYFADAVVWAKNTGVTTGMTETLFGPSGTVKRGQAVTFLWRANGKPEPSSAANPFKDVKSTDYFYKAVLWAVENGITNGMSATEFGPDNNVKREQMVTFLWRAMGSPAKTGNGAYYDDAVSWANSLKLLDGTANAFRVGDECPRADVVTYLYRYANQ